MGKTSLNLSGLRTYKRGVRPATRDGTRETADDLVQAQQLDVAVDEGDLYDSIRREPGVNTMSHRVIAGDPSATKDDGRPVDYAPFVEAEQPFVGPTVKAIDPGANTARNLRALARKSKV